MGLDEFRSIRRGMQSNAAPASAAARASVASALAQALEDSELFVTIEVETTQDDDRLVIAMVTFHPGLPVPTISAGIERLWRDRVGFAFWQAHITLDDADHVELQGISRSSSTGGFVTVHVVAQAAAQVDTAVTTTVSPQTRRRLLSWSPMGSSRRA